VLPVGLVDEPVEQRGVEPGVPSASMRSVSNPARLPSTAVQMNSNSITELSGERERTRPLSLSRVNFSPTQPASCLYCRTGKPSAVAIAVSAARSSCSSSSRSRSGCS
jgi:hypothetical protein